MAGRDGIRGTDATKSGVGKPGRIVLIALPRHSGGAIAILVFAFHQVGNALQGRQQGGLVVFLQF